MPRWERAAARANHWMIYALLLAAPLAGWLYASAAGLGVSWFGLLQLPDLVTKDRDLAGFFKAAHVGLVALLAALVALHVGAALHHAFVRRDGIVQRMWPRKAQARTP
jgi:cytochrome b561